MDLYKKKLCEDKLYDRRTILYKEKTKLDYIRRDYRKRKK